jgi:hypothetical protein
VRLYACHFGGGHWDDMARVLDYSARKHCPGWGVTIATILPPPDSTLDPSYTSNSAKLEAWASAVMDAEDGEGLCLMDADCMVLRDLTPIWSHGFDFAYTLRSPGRLPLNAGVVFVRKSERIERFFLAWRDTNRKMLADRRYHAEWRPKFGGINQAALGAVLASGLASKIGVELLTVPCREWNCEDSSWQEFNPDETRVVHLKSGLRRSVFGIGSTSRQHGVLRRIWKALEREASA